MKRPLMIVAVVAGFALSLSARTVWAQEDPYEFLHGYVPSTNAEEDAQRRAFEESVLPVELTGAWYKAVDLARAEEKAHPGNPGGPFAEGVGLLYDGDLEGAQAAWKPLRESAPSLVGKIDWFEGQISRIRANFPDLKLKPFALKENDQQHNLRQYRDKSEGLLKDKKYDEIERTAKELQKPDASDVLGTPFLDVFFEGLSAVDGGFVARQAQLAAWQKAQPKSALARLAAAKMWVSEAAQRRGSGYAYTITPEMQAKMNEALEHAAKAVTTLPPSASESPLIIRVLLDFGRLAGMERAQMDGIAAQGMKQFPWYQTTYQLQSVNLMPKWYGGPGETKALIEKRAKQIGGDEGDIFYAQLVETLLDQDDNVWKNLGLSYPRFQHGMRLLAARNPNSLALRNTALQGAIQQNDTSIIKAYFAAPDGEILDYRWYRYPLYISQARLTGLASGEPASPSVP